MSLSVATSERIFDFCSVTVQLKHSCIRLKCIKFDVFVTAYLHYCIQIKSDVVKKKHNLQTSVLNLTLCLETGLKRLYVIIDYYLRNRVCYDIRRLPERQYKSFIKTLEFILHGWVTFRVYIAQDGRGYIFRIYTFSIKHK